MNYILFIFGIIFLLNGQTKISIFYNGEIDKKRSFSYKFIVGVIKLYNRNQSDDSLEFEIFQKNNFFELFDTMLDTTDYDKKLAIGSITISDERKKKYDFSPYIPLRNILICLNNSEINQFNWANSNFKIGYFKGTSQERLVMELAKKSEIIPVGIELSNIEDVSLKLNNKLFDMMFVEGFSHKENITLREVTIYYDQNLSYGIMYPKNSRLKLKLQKYINYFMTSSMYYDLLRKTYGKDINKVLFQSKYYNSQNE
jgi:hypothetical protein